MAVAEPFAHQRVVPGARATRKGLTGNWSRDDDVPAREGSRFIGTPPSAGFLAGNGFSGRKRTRLAASHLLSADRRRTVHVHCPLGVEETQRL